MRILILDTTKQHTSQYGRKILAEIFKDHSEDIFAIATSKGSTANKQSTLKRLKNNFKQGNFLFVINYLFRIRSLVSKEKVKWLYSEVEAFHDLKEYKKEIVFFDKINSPELEEYVVKNEIDVIFHSGGMILKPNILNAPKIGVVGYHHGDITKYRGPFQCFWELYFGEKQIGVTVQILRSELDTGPIIAQEFYNVPEKIKLRELQKISNWDSFHLGSKALSIIKKADANFSSDYKLGVYRSYPNLMQLFFMLFKGKI